MHLPPYGLCLSATLVHVRDGDTIVVRVREGGFEWAVRMADCWVTDDRASLTWRNAYDVAKRAAQEASDAGTLSVFLPIESLPNNLLSGVSFDRVIGYVFVDSQTTIGELLVRMGLAGRTRKDEPR